MADQQGWWKIVFTPEGIDLSDIDLEHIGASVTDGFREGQILPDGPDADADDGADGADGPSAGAAAQDSQAGTATGDAPPS